jgi:hypothetical protein
MATLDSLKQALREKAKAAASPIKRLSDIEYSAGFEILLQGSGWITYQDFVIPQLSKLLAALLTSRIHISVLEIGPGPKSLLGYLSNYLRRKINKYTTFEPNGLFATSLEEWFSSTSRLESPLPCLENSPNIHRNPFGPQDNIGSSTPNNEKYDIILFCHSMYSIRFKRKFIELALEILVDRPKSGIVVVFHRNSLYLDGLVCHQTASFPTGFVSVENDDKALDCFTAFVVGFIQSVDIRVEWREVCRSLGRRKKDDPNHLLFSSPSIIVALNQHATALPELTEQVPLGKGYQAVKNREARLHRPATTVRPTEVRHVQQCIQ